MVSESQLKEIIKEEVLNELLTQKLKSLTTPALLVLVKNYTTHKQPEVLVDGLPTEERKRQRLIYILNQETNAENRLKMEKEMPAWRWGWTRNANRERSDAALAGKKYRPQKK